MTEKETRGRNIKRQVFDLLKSKDMDEAVVELCKIPGRQVVNPLISLLCSHEDQVRWKAIVALGVVVNGMAHSGMEDARVVMRRFMWMLNDESGGIGWGVPEAMGEIMALNEALAREYSSVLVSYADEEGNFLEYEALQRGLLWGIGRLSEVRPHLTRAAGPHLCKYLRSKDAAVRGLAARAIGLIEDRGCVAELGALTDDYSPLIIFRDRMPVQTFVARIVAETLARIGSAIAT